jgi:hypothetical protein
VSHRRHWGSGSTGATFFEVAIVLTLMGALIVLSILATKRFIQRAKASATAAQMAFVRNGLLSFAANCEGLPVSAASGGDPGLLYAPNNIPCWSGPYLTRWPDATSFGHGSTYRYQGAPGSPAALIAQDLSPSDALALSSEVRRTLGGQVHLDSTTRLWSVTVPIGEYYRR